MRRRAASVFGGGFLIAAVTAAGSAAAPGMKGGGPDPRVERQESCDSDPGVEVGWILAPDITAVGAVEVGNLPEDCRRQNIRVTLRDGDGQLLARTTKRGSPAGSTVVIELEGEVPAAAIALVEVVIGGTPKG